MTPNKFKHLTTKGRITSTVIILTVWRVPTAAPTSYSEPIRLMPLIPSGAALRIVVITSIFSNLLLLKPIVNPVITRVKVIKIAGFHKLWISTRDSLVNEVPINVPIPTSKIVLVPIGHSVKSDLPLMLNMLVPI